MNTAIDIRRMKTLGYGVSTCFCIIASGMYFFFNYFGVKAMTGYNIFSVLFYVFSFLLLRYEKFWIYSISVYLEVVVHMSLAVVFVGVGGGFQITLIGMNLLAFYSEYLSVKANRRQVSGLVLGCIGTLAYLGGYLYSWFFPPAYELPQSISFWLQAVMGIIVFVVNIFFLKLFVTITLNSERVLADAQTKANSMVTALSSDYRSVYYVNLDDNTGICYREDIRDKDQTPEGVAFPFYEHFYDYGRHRVAENYRDGFMNFIAPKNIRESLAEKPLITYRYLVQRDGYEYYEMIRMAGVRRVEERDDHMVHSIGLGIVDIDGEMRETMTRNEALAEALVLAEQANNAKTAFLSSMSHEIRTPMNAIIGLDTLALHDASISGQTRGYLEKIGSSAKHLLALINDILDMSRIESGRMVLRTEEFSFTAMLDQINTMVMSQCSDKGITYECSVLSHLDDYYIGDDMKLKEILINILSNAIKFTESPGSVALTVEQTAMFEDQATIQFRVRDTGIGMDADYIPKIFDAFSQEDGSRKSRYGSTGLGMAITKNLVEMMNGTIDVESEKGVGTEFIVSVTLRTSDHEAEGRDNTVEPGKIHALVADEDEVAAEHARMVLEEAGIRTDVCINGKEVLNMMELQKTKRDQYNLVLLDRKLPGTPDRDASAMIREHFGRGDTVIIMTAFDWDDFEETSITSEFADADGFLTKPLFAERVTEEFIRAVHRNNMSLGSDTGTVELKGRRVLLAEDIEINAEIMKEILEMNEITADHARNGRIVVEMFENSDVGTYAAILMDVRMPEMDGLEAAAAIRAMDREDAKRIPIIALTANAFDEDVQRSLQAGMNAHLTKPVEPELLVETLGKLISETAE